MATRRTYGDACGVAHALDLVGERWSLLVARELLLGPKRFTDLAAGLPGASPNVLSERLRELEASGVIRRRRLPPPAAARIYELTEWGRDLEPAVLALGRWGSRSPLLDPTAHLSPDAAVLALRTFFAPDPGERWDATYELRLEPHRFALRVAGGRLDVHREEPAAPDATIDTDPHTFVSLLAEPSRLDAMPLTGDREAVRRLLAAVRMP